MLERDSLSKQIYAQLKKIIILQETPGFHMGEKINEAAIAKLFECSVTPVRESINMLRGDGLIVGESYRSSAVVRFTEKDVRDYFELRECLETLALRKCFVSLTDDLLKELCGIQEAYQKSYIDFDECGIIDTNRDFHNRLIELAGNKALSDELAAISDLISMMRAPIAQRRHQLAKGDKNVLLLPVREHEELLSALKRRDLAGAEAALCAHLERVKNDACEYYRLCDNQSYEY